MVDVQERYLVRRELGVIQDLIRHRQIDLDHKEVGVEDKSCSVAKVN